ncbi:hypothetical protein [Nocardia sp. NPDC051832]|uniref:hypothetical protein n=1 Tax=Nocardia sp. NPDC051832 TaxID=3155673 RepID=UPI0034195BA3
MEHGQQGGDDSIGEIISGIAEILREVSDKLDAVAARVDGARDESSVAARLAKLEAWAFRTDQDISKLGTRIEGVEGGPRAGLGAAVTGSGSGSDPSTRSESATRSEPATGSESFSRSEPVTWSEPGSRSEPGTRSESSTRSEAGTRTGSVTSSETVARSEPVIRTEPAVRDEPATRAERRELARAENPTPAQSELPQRSTLPQRGGAPARAEAEPRAERPLPRAVANRGPQAPARADQSEPLSARGTAPVADTAFSSERRLPTVPAALNDWVEPVDPAPALSSERLEPVGITPRSDRFTPTGITEAAPTTAPQGLDYVPLRSRTDETPRNPALTELPTRTPQSPANLNGRSESFSGSTEITGRSETQTPASVNGRLESLTSPDNTHFTGRPDSSPHITGSGRLEPPLSGAFDSLTPTPNGSGLTSPRPEPDIATTAPQRPTAEDNAHVDKLQAMLDELKRNPHGPFGRPLGTPPGELPA